MNKIKKIISIRLKIIIYLIILIIIVQGFFYLFSNSIILKNYTILENNYIQLNLTRIDKIIQDKFKQQQVKLKDWSIWDDTYNFILNNNSDYIATNLNTESLINLNVNSLTFVNDRNEIVYNKMVDLMDSKELNSSSLSINLKSYVIDKNHNPEQYIHGLINTEKGIMFVSSGPVYKSDGTGPIVGSLIIGNILDRSVIDDISDNISYNVDIKAFGDSNNTQDFIEAQIQLTNSNNQDYRVADQNNIAGYSLLYDINNKPIAITKITIPREFYKQSTDAYTVFTGIILLLLLLFGVFIIYLVEKVVMVKLLKLNNEISKINEAKDFNKRLSVYSNDEIGNISNIINTMLDELQKSQDDERIKINSDKEYLDNEKKHISEINKMNDLMVGRELEMVALKKEINELKK